MYWAIIPVIVAPAVLGKQPASSAPAAEPAAKRPKKEEEDFNDVLQVRASRTCLLSQNSIRGL